MDKRTPGPWTVANNGFALGILKYDDEGNYTVLARIPSYFVSDVEMKANAEFIVRACNSHDELLTACEATAAWFSKFCLTHSFIFAGAPDLVDAVNAAIASAKEI